MYTCIDLIGCNLNFLLSILVSFTSFGLYSSLLLTIEFFLYLYISFLTFFVGIYGILISLIRNIWYCSILFPAMQTVPACQNLYRNSFTYHCLPDEKTLPFDDANQFLGLFLFSYSLIKFFLFVYVFVFLFQFSILILTIVLICFCCVSNIYVSQ